MTDDGWVNFEQNRQTSASALCDLSQLGLIRITGRDRMDFLQGQFTSDIRELTPEKCQLSAYCNPKGHMLASGWFFCRGDEIFFQLPSTTLPAVLKRLSMFVLRSEVKLTDAGETLIRMGLIGDQAAEQLGKLIPNIPTTPQQVVQADDLTVIQLPGSVPRFEIIGSEAAIKKIWGALAEEAQPTSSHFWALQDIRAGIPTIYPSTVEAFIPQMVNMQLLDAISFTKGCYCGQEIVARTQHRRTLKRRMYLAHISGDHPPRAGDALFSQSAEHGKSAGIVVDAQPTSEGGYDALVMVQIPCVEADDIYLKKATGEKLDFRELPYAFTPD